MKFGWSGKVIAAAFWCFLIAIILIFAGVALAFAGNIGAYGILILVAGGLMIFTSILVTVYWFITLIEITTSNNGTNWKILWAAIVFFVGIIGLVIYERIGKKELK